MNPLRWTLTKSDKMTHATGWGWWRLGRGEMSQRDIVMCLRWLIALTLALLLVSSRPERVFPST